MAIKNTSSNEKTVKGMYSKLDQDIYTVDKTLLYVSYRDPKYQIGYRTILDSYRDYFESKYLDTVELSSQFYYSPSGFSENYYGTPDLDFLVLYFAKCPSLLEFNKKQITVLRREALLEINKLFTYVKNQVDNSYTNPVSYVKTY